jgi:dipeptidyl-peptidase-4
MNLALMVKTFGVLKEIFSVLQNGSISVTDYPIIDWTTRPAKNENIKYPMAGNKSHHVTLGIYDVKTTKLFL